MKRLCALAVVCTAAHAAERAFQVAQVFSNADGTVQFVQLRESAGQNGQPGLAGNWPITMGFLNDVCRYYIPPEHGNSHFFSASTAECDTIASRIGVDPNYSGYLLGRRRHSPSRCPTRPGRARAAGRRCTGSGTIVPTRITATPPTRP